MSSSHSDLAVSVQEGDQSAFCKLSAEFSPAILSIIDSYDVTISERDDIYQEGLLGLYKAALTYKAHMNTAFSTFARICIKHSIISALRTYYGNKNYPLLSSLSIDKVMEEFGDIQAPCTSSDPESLLIEQEELDTLVRIINVNLSQLERKVLKLFVQGKTYGEISERLSISIKSVGNAIQRIRNKLRSLIRA